MGVKIHNCSNNNTIFNTNSWVEYDEKVAVALGKQTPKKPQAVDVDFSTFVCPSCLSTIMYTNEKETHNYCLNCGQKLDWREGR